MLKAELHTHINLDPQDHRFITYNAYDLIDAAVEQGFQILAITCHDFWYEDPQAKKYAAERGLLLLSGIERTIEGKHTLLYNISSSLAMSIHSFDDLHRARQDHPDMLVIAAHPFHFGPTCLKKTILTNADLFDAWEYSFFHVSFFDPNQKTVTLAKKYGKPIVGNSDVHKLKDLGRTYTLIDVSAVEVSAQAPNDDLADVSVDAPIKVDAQIDDPLNEQKIFQAIRQGKVQVVTKPLPLLEAAHITGKALFHMARKKMTRFLGG